MPVAGGLAGRLRPDERHPRDRRRQRRGRGPARGYPGTSSTRPWPRSGSSTRCPRASPAPRSAATSAPTPAGCGPSATASPGTTCSASRPCWPGGEVIRTGGKFVKSSTGYDLTQLIIGSEGTLAAGHRGHREAPAPPRPHGHRAGPLRHPGRGHPAVPRIVASGVGPLILEYLDALTMASGHRQRRARPGRSPRRRAGRRSAYLVVVLESTHDDRLEVDAEAGRPACWPSWAPSTSSSCPPRPAPTSSPPGNGPSTWPRPPGPTTSSTPWSPGPPSPAYLATVAGLARRRGALVPGCGHVGDGNVHLSVFQPDPDAGARLLHAIMRPAAGLGGAVSGEHGIGTAKLAYFARTRGPGQTGPDAPDQGRLRPPRHPRSRAGRRPSSSERSNR